MKSRSSPYRIMLWVGLILVAFMVYRAFDQGTLKSPFEPTPTATRTIQSFEQEGDTFFQIGNLDAAIQAYLDAAKIDPNNAELWTKLARIQTYSSASLTTDEQILQRLTEARDSIDKALKIDPESSDAHAVKAFVLDWFSSAKLIKEDVRTLLNEAEAEATRALALDEQNVQALAFTAEIQVDQQKWLQAQQTINLALERDPNSMDVHRINAYVLSSLQDYQSAIEEYKRALELAPNLTYIYIEIGKIYRYLATSGDWENSAANFQTALEYFTKAEDINRALDLKNPIPYLAKAKTYTQRGDAGDFFLAILEVKTALDLNPGSNDVYAQLGLVYHQARNYEGAIEAFRCALEGCPPEKSCVVRDDCEDATRSYTIQPLTLTDNTLVYFYTYVSVMSALSKPTNSNCTDVAWAFTKLRESYGSDDFVMSFVTNAEGLCRAGTNPVRTPTSQVTPSQIGTATKKSLTPTP